VLRLIRIAQITTRLTGLALIVLGALIWAGNPALKNAHMGLGLLFVIALWSITVAGAIARTGTALVLRGAIWGVVVLWLGMVQARIWPGESHVYVRVLHLVVGLVAIGIAEMFAARIKKGLTAAAKV